MKCNMWPCLELLKQFFPIQAKPCLAKLTSIHHKERLGRLGNPMQFTILVYELVEQDVE